MSGSSSPDASTEARTHFEAHLLLVDDNVVSNAVVTSMLRDMGCSVEVAVNGRQALETLDSGSFDLVLMDCEMPVMDGMTATRKLREREVFDGVLTPVPVIAFTTHDREQVEALCMNAGMDAWLHKPCSRQDLIAILHRWVELGADRGTSAETITSEQAIITDEMLEGATSSSERRSFDLVREMLIEERIDELESLVQLFTEHTEKDLDDMRQALQAGDFARLRRCAHVVRTSSASLGAMRLADLCRKLYASAAAAEHSHCRPLIAAIEDEYALVSEALQAECRAIRYA